MSCNNSLALLHNQLGSAFKTASSCTVTRNSDSIHFKSFVNKVKVDVKRDEISQMK